MTLDEARLLYDELTTRNRGFVSDASQQRLATSTVLVAGCGSTGGAAVEPLVRLGVQHFVLADNGEYELNNLNRQSAALDDVGSNKAAVCGRRVLAVNPYATVTVETEGITADNAARLVVGSDVVVDGVDVTEHAGWLAKYALHEAAARYGRPVISGYDMAGTQYVRVYGYRPGSRPFNGRVDRVDVANRATWALLRRVVPLRAVPVQMLESARTAVRTGEDSVPQLVYASWLFGAVASRVVLDVLDGTPVRRSTVVSVDRAVRPARARLSDALRKPIVLVAALLDLAALTAADKRAAGEKAAHTNVAKRPAQPAERHPRG